MRSDPVFQQLGGLFAGAARFGQTGEYRTTTKNRHMVSVVPTRNRPKLGKNGEKS
jgi:hypothetical protein